MKHALVRTLAVAASTALLMAACSDEGDSFEPGAPIPTEPSAPTATTAPDTTTADTEPQATTPPEDTTPDIEPPDATEPNDTTPTTGPAPSTTQEAPSTTDELEVADTPQAPGFDFPPADLETDPNSPNNNREILPEDQPIIDAYLAAFEADLAALSTWPLDPNSAVLRDAPFTDSVFAAYESGMAERTGLNQVLDVSGGLTSRPYVLQDDGDPDRAIVWDCQVDATFWKDVDTGQKAPPDVYPNVGPPGVESGTATEMVRVDGDWLVNAGETEARACL